MERRECKRLEKIKFTGVNKLNLRYMTLQEAFKALRSFMFDSYQNGIRDVLVVTGKGRKFLEHDKPKGAIRSRFPEWLQHEDIKPYVIDSCQAARHHGGEGAWYVRLHNRTRSRSKG